VKEFHMSITRSKPFYAVAGVTDAAVKSLREVPAKLPTVRIERKDVEKAVANLQAEAVAFPSKAQSTAVGLAGEVVGRADSVYTDLVVRGRSVVTRIRRQKASQDLSAQAATTVRRTKATSTSAQNTAGETTRTAKKAATRTKSTAAKKGATTRSTAKSATTSARKTAESAVRATTDGADKLGR
jgi:heparin binding hemagglutinin HbhA